ncbi:hypothetical protein BX666DRAFT_2128669 [Dichotomocladium elegans]|nr:hypothetical protein BX666DRAFT_2128669 [Dichotomocladium elegans]
MVFTSPFPRILEEPQCNVVEFIFQNRYNVPDSRPMLIDAVTRDQLTYGELREGILKFAAGLQDTCGFKKGDTALIYAPNHVCGAASPANPNYTPRELVHQLLQVKAKVLIAHPANYLNALEAAREVGLPRDRIFLFGNQSFGGCLPFKSLMKQRTAQIVQLSPEEAKELPAYLCFSSGTTGQSKGVMTTQSTHANMCINILQYLAIEGKFFDGSRDRTFVTLPYFHIFALNILVNVATFSGLCVFVLERFNLEVLCELIEREHITFGYLVPPILLQIAKNPIASKYNLSSLRWIMSAAAPLGTNLMRALRVRLPQTVIKQAYGLTETSPVAINEPVDQAREGSVGFLVPNMFAKIVNEEGKEVGYGEPGEIWLKGPNIMKGYINNPKETAACIDADGYFHSGDVGLIQEDGRFYIVDRLKELIKYKGFQVAPAELESILLKSPDVEDCAVIGLYDESQATEIPVACVKLTSQAVPSSETAVRLMSFIAKQVVAYKQVRLVVFMDNIPKSEAGKILRRVLRERIKDESKHTYSITTAKL